VIKKYNELLMLKLKEQTIPEWVQTLYQATSKGWLHQQEKQEFEKIDNTITAAWIYVEHHCWKFKCGQVAWCPQVTRAFNRILYWKGIQSWQHGS